MTNRAAQGLGETCPTCGFVHMSKYDKPACVGHVTHDRDSYVKGQDRKKLDQPRACTNPPMHGQPVCQVHGGRAANGKAAGQRRETERKATEAVLRKLGDAGETVTDPVAKLCEIAGRACALMEGLAERVDQLGDEADRNQARADIVVYGRAIQSAASVVESIIRMGIAERFAKQNAEAVAAYVSCLDAILTDLGHNPREPQTAGVIAKHLALVS